MRLFQTKVLLATDGSEEAEMAATTAVNLANNTHSELHILTVGPGYPAYDVRVPEVAEELRQQTQEILDEQTKKIEQAGGKIAQRHLRLAENHPGFEHHPSDDVVRVAEEIGAGLIVLGTRGRGGVRRALMGSVSDSVVRHAHCPVMMVRGEAVVFPNKILVATDRSEEAELAARTAADLAKSSGSELHVVHVAHMERVFATEPEIEALVQQRAQEARELLDEEVERIEAAGGTPAQTHLKVGKPDAEITHLAEELGAGLIILGSRGRGGIRRALMGSVSSSVVQHAHCPVMVVRPEKQTAT